ncbi:Magnesium transporter MgtE [Thalassoglobus neptunius]|uniref:Magnesium transporter MgtE n=1 Tax=Thalassoglobus neptunius TaxID=1938619 RepID=A0A5C5X6V0_9PLAN|nr:magnesium transporter [Thalassoglobus neptunius]TWT58379.1 Magnesium transporter MgtE [Thalassoglobus neptunius]
MTSSIFHSLLEPDIVQMIQGNDELGLREFCTALYPGVVAEILEDMEPEEAWKVLKHAPASTQGEIFPFFDISFQVKLVELVGDKPLSRIIEEMSGDDRVDLLERMDPDHVETVLRLVAQAERSDIRKLLSYPEYSAGSIMTTEYASLPADISVKEALERLRVQAPSRETIYYIYITDEGRHLLGFLSLRKLILAKPTTRLEEIMQRDVICVRVDDDQEHVANEIARYDFIAIPVVDNQNRLVGIVTHDDAADVMQEEATEDAHLLGAVQPLEDGYVATPFFELAWKRGVWLVILLFAASMTAKVLQYFDPGDGGTWMVLFLPMVLASGGNAGSQSATLVIRALALHETDGRVSWIAWREIRIGALLGAILALISFIVAYLMIGIQASMVVTLTVFLVVTVGTLSGAMLPLGLKRLGMDPAFMSNPLIAALSDMLGVVIYYSTASATVQLFTTA